MSQLGFTVEWFDRVSNSLETLYLKIYLIDGTIELLNSKTNSIFLKRISYPQVKLSDCFIGNSISIFNRLLVIKSYTNTSTEAYMKDRECHVLCTLKSSAYAFIGDIFKLGSKYNLSTGKVKTAGMGGDFLIELVCANDKDMTKFVADVCALSGDVDAEIAGVADIQEVLKRSGAMEMPQNCTLCIIKPHIRKSGNCGELMQYICESGYTIQGIASAHLHSEMAEEFFSVYRHIHSYYRDMMSEVTSAPLLALMITKDFQPGDTRMCGSQGWLPSSVVADFRDFCGPNSPHLARLVRQDSLRAKFGGNSCVENAVHCTELPDDGVMECNFFFQTMMKLN